MFSPWTEDDGAVLVALPGYRVDGAAPGGGSDLA